jgi:hypothetical protein
MFRNSTFEFKFFLRYKIYKSYTETFGGTFFYIYVDVRLLDLHAGAVFVNLLMLKVYWNNSNAI